MEISKKIPNPFLRDLSLWNDVCPSALHQRISVPISVADYVTSHHRVIYSSFARNIGWSASWIALSAASKLCNSKDLSDKLFRILKCNVGFDILRVQFDYLTCGHIPRSSLNMETIITLSRTVVLIHIDCRLIPVEGWNVSIFKVPPLNPKELLKMLGKYH